MREYSRKTYRYFIISTVLFLFVFALAPAAPHLLLNYYVIVAVTLVFLCLFVLSCAHTPRKAIVWNFLLWILVVYVIATLICHTYMESVARNPQESRFLKASTKEQLAWRKFGPL